MPQFNSISWDNRAWAANEKVAARIRNIFNQAVRESVDVVSSLKRLKSYPFSFDQYPQLSRRVNQLFQRMARNIQTNINDGSIQAWAIANAKNDALIDWASKNTGIHSDLLRKYQYGARNNAARDAFMNRVENGMNLSERVWRIVGQARQEIEMSLDLGLGQGKSAAQLSKDVRQLLQEPNKLFRRVRDKHGQLQLSKNALAYHPGQGVYRSSYKNAFRLTRTENNMAYREADFQRWQELDFVVGMEVRTSNNPNTCPVCQSLKGKYPKKFKFLGWHPQCRCYMIPILMTKGEFSELELKLLRDENPAQVESKREIKGVPDGFVKWVRENRTRVRSWTNTLYWVRDNFKDGDIQKKLFA